MHKQAVLSLAAATLAFGAAAGPAHAATGTVKVNKGYTLKVHKTPSSSSAVVRKLANNAKVTIVCQTSGSSETGRFGTSRIWDKLAGGGYVSDTYVYTGSDRRVAPACGASTTPAPTPAPATPAPSSGLPKSVTLKDDYEYRNGNPNNADKWGFFQRECTSFVASRLNRVKPFSNRMKGGHFGNAITWDDNARRIGMKVNRTPTVGSVMVRNSGRAGHVAIVAKVKGRKIYVEQYNAQNDHKYSQQWLDVTSVMTFIHV